MTLDYPLNCLSNTGDGFSGWFAITDPKVCKDFCYWSSSNSDSNDYTSSNTANPHEITVIRNDNETSYWECVYNADGDDVLTLEAIGQRWIDTYQQFIRAESMQSDDVPFPYLKCQKGSSEKLSTWDVELVQSALFWEYLIALSATILLVQLIMAGIFWKRRRRRYELIGRRSINDRIGGSDSVYREEELEFHSLQLDDNDMPLTLQNITRIPSSIPSDSFSLEHQQYAITQRWRFCAPSFTKLCSNNKWTTSLQIVLIVALNILLLCSIAFSSISLMEIHSSPYFQESMRQWTPACSNPDLVCEAGNQDINRESTMAKKSSPFSYLIASDAQLNWFNGEFAQMGQQNIPNACTTSDSCWSCTRKHGRETNLRLKSAMERIMLGEGLPVADTLIMNGDLTAYFHPSEKHIYESIYKDIVGLKSYFPSLGNHDIEHMSGGRYGGDQWNGPPNCNIEHAIGYFKGGFCNQIPKFDSDRITRYDASSLAYSWEEGRYHFVHTHYYPTYEMASMKYRSSIEWLEKDLAFARDAGLTTVLFVHAANYLNPAMEKVILGKNVVAIFAGHDHRCLHRRCDGIYPIHEDQLGSLEVEKCIPAAYDTCQVLNGENLLYVKYISENVTMPKRRMKNHERTDQPLCPKPTPFYINQTDNTLLCRQVRYNHPNFPSGNNHSESIPIFWSGSASLETFLRADFFEDKIVINALALTADGRASRYIDMNHVPDALYPFHDTADLEEIVINVQ